MKQIKFLILLFLIVFVCGCEAEYNLDIDDNYLETIRVYSTTTEEADYFKANYSSFKYTASILDSYEPFDEPPEEYEYYKIDLFDDNNILASYKFSDKFSNSRAANKCYSSFVIFNKKNTRINTLGYFDCFDIYPDLDKVTVNIKVSYKVVNHNADEVNDNVYTWTILRDNNRAINIEFENHDVKGTKKDIVPSDNQTKNNDYKNVKSNKTKKKSSSSTLVYLLISLFFMFLFGIIMFMNKYRKSK